MRTVIGHVVLALVLAAAGGACWRLGQIERALAGAREELATLRYGVAADRAGDLEPTLRYAAPLPVVGAQMMADSRDNRATAGYWLGRYDALRADHDASGAAIARDSQQLFLASNAAFRATQVETVDRPTALSHLEGVVKSYADVLKASPGDADAAYNYEFVVRARDALARARGFSKLSIAETTPTIHGRPGAPPKGVSMSSFKVMVPQRSDERKNSQEAGKGGAKPRKG